MRQLKDLLLPLSFAASMLAGCGNTSDMPAERSDASADLQHGNDSSAGQDGIQPTGTDPSCQGVADYQDCTATRYLLGNVVHMTMTDTAQAFPLNGKCYKGTCCSGCVANGACVQPSSQSDKLFLSPGMYNGCGTDAAACVDCNAPASTKQTCSYILWTSDGHPYYDAPKSLKASITAMCI